MLLVSPDVYRNLSYVQCRISINITYLVVICYRSPYNIIYSAQLYRTHQLRLKWFKFNFGRGSATDPAGELPDPVAGFMKASDANKASIIKAKAKVKAMISRPRPLEEKVNKAKNQSRRNNYCCNNAR